MQVRLRGHCYRQTRWSPEDGSWAFPSAVIFEVVLDLTVQIGETEIFWWGQSWQGAELGWIPVFQVHPCI